MTTARLGAYRAVNQIEIVDAHGCAVLNSELNIPGPEDLTAAIKKNTAAFLENKISFQVRGV